MLTIINVGIKYYKLNLINKNNNNFVLINYFLIPVYFGTIVPDANLKQNENGLILEIWPFLLFPRKCYNIGVKYQKFKKIDTNHYSLESENSALLN